MPPVDSHRVDLHDDERDAYGHYVCSPPPPADRLARGGFVRVGMCRAVSRDAARAALRPFPAYYSAWTLQQQL